jgi:hypothetical protein
MAQASPHAIAFAIFSWIFCLKGLERFALISLVMAIALAH